MPVLVEAPSFGIGGSEGAEEEGGGGGGCFGGGGGAAPMPPTAPPRPTAAGLKSGTAPSMVTEVSGTPKVGSALIPRDSL